MSNIWRVKFFLKQLRLPRVGIILPPYAIFVGTLSGSSQGLIDDLALVGGYSLLGLVFSEHFSLGE